MNNNDILSHIIKCWNRNIPFAAFALPEESKLRLFVNPSYPEGYGERFIISPWLADFESSISIYNEIDPVTIDSVDIQGSPENTMFPIPTESTVKAEYVMRLSELILKLKEDGRKTVISRVICGDTGNLDLYKFISLRFKHYPSTFRFVFYTPETGLWIGTSPEELLSYDKNTERFSISSLAGTKKVQVKQDWDAKNIMEQSMVSRYIGDVLSGFGIKYISKICNDVSFHPVVHRCHRFFGYMKEGIIPQLLDSLSPTPALCGFPKDAAIRDINDVEHFNRCCYGGYIGYESNNNLILYVNLRSIMFAGDRYAIYAGGGITGASNAEREWEETASKSETMLADLSQYMVD